MDLLIRNKECKVENNLINIVSMGGILKYIGFDILRLRKGKAFILKKDNIETAAVMISGKCTIKLNNLSYENIGSRSSIFDGDPTTVYIPTGEEFAVEAITDVEIGLCYAKSNKKKNPFIVEPKNIITKNIGRDCYRRTAKFIISEDQEVDRIYVGETIVSNGNWASFPPHKHDRDLFPTETKLEEIYHYRLNPSQGFAIQKIYTEKKDIDETYTVNNFDTVLVPRGYHPQISCPGYELRYIWILGGKKRQYKLFEDRDHAWVNE